jgi:CBS domain-containing protein
MLKLRDIMTRDVATVTTDMTVRDAMGVLTSRHVSGAPVVEGERVVGVVTAADLLALVATVPGVPRAADRPAEEGGTQEPAPDIPEASGGRDAFYTELWTEPPPDASADASADSSAAEPGESRDWSSLDEHTVREAMTDAVISLPPDAPVTDAAERIRAAGIHRVLVVDGERLEGIVSVLDIARAVADRRLASREYVFHTVPRGRRAHGGGLLGAIGRDGRHMEGEGTLTLADVMTSDVVTVSPDLNLRDAIRLLAGRHIGGVPVLVGRAVAGVVSASDLMAFAASLAGVPSERAQETGPESDDEWTPAWDWDEGDEPAATYFTELWADAGASVDERFADAAAPEWDVLGEHTVAEVMTRSVCALSPSVSVVAAADYMHRSHIHRVLVMRKHELLGIVSASDVANAVAQRRALQRRRLFDDETAFDRRGWQLEAPAQSNMPSEPGGEPSEESHADRH